jgi:non-ribosomal peptide synthetase component F
VNQPGDKENARGINKDSENTYLHTAGISKFDMALTCRDRGENIENGLLFTLEYSSRLFKPRTIERFIGYFKTATSIVLTRPRVKLAEIQILNKEERHRVLLEFNQTAAAYPKDKTIHQLFARQVEKTPNQIAVVGPLQLKYRTYISYKELNEKTDQLAEILRGNGVQADTIVGLMAERSIETIIGILGILKPGLPKRTNQLYAGRQLCQNSFNPARNCGALFAEGVE